MRRTGLLAAFFGLLGAVLPLGCSHPPPKAAPVPTVEWSDAQVLAYALVARQQANARTSATRVAPYRGVLGRHHGLTLMQTVSCGDTGCAPDQFDLVVHYALPNGTDCERAGGVTERMKIFAQYSSRNRTFCIPQVLADHWPDIARTFLLP